MRERQASVVVRNVNTGISIDIRWAIDDELSQYGMEGDTMLDSNTIEQLFTDNFFNQYCISTLNYSLKELFYKHLTQEYGYPNKLVDKEDILYLIQRLSEEQYQY